MAEATDKSKKTDVKLPVRFYHPNPQAGMRLYREGSRKMLSFRQGVMQVDNEEDLALARKSLKGIAFEEDWPDDKPTHMCPKCGYAPRSFEAARLHQFMHPIL